MRAANGDSAQLYGTALSLASAMPDRASLAVMKLNVVICMKNTAAVLFI
jgi:hypothetical protein